MAGHETEPLVAAAQTVVDTGEPQIWRGINRVLGESYDIPAEVSLSPVKDSAGLVRGVLAVALDMSEQHVARRRLALVNEARTRIGGTLDMTTTAEELVAVTVPQLADLASA
jgi:hypothetical protein